MSTDFNKYQGTRYGIEHVGPDVSFYLSGATHNARQATYVKLSRFISGNCPFTVAGDVWNAIDSRGKIEYCISAGPQDSYVMNAEPNPEYRDAFYSEFGTYSIDLGMIPAVRDFHNILVAGITTLELDNNAISITEIKFNAWGGTYILLRCNILMFRVIEVPETVPVRAGNDLPETVSSIPAQSTDAPRTLHRRATGTSIFNEVQVIDSVLPASPDEALYLLMAQFDSLAFMNQFTEAACIM